MIKFALAVVAAVAVVVAVVVVIVLHLNFFKFHNVDIRFGKVSKIYFDMRTGYVLLFHYDFLFLTS